MTARVLIEVRPANDSREVFYVNNTFWGRHCVICGAILDPVILHRLSQNADL